MSQRNGDTLRDLSPTTQRKSSGLTTRRIPSRILLDNNETLKQSVVPAIADDDEELLQSLEATDDDTSDWLNEALDLRLGKRSGLGLEDDTNVSAPKSGLDRRTTSNGGGGIHALLAVDAQLSHLSTMLSVARQDTLASMDETMASISSAVPRLGLELRLMHDTATTLKGNIERLRRQTESVGIQRTTTVNSEIYSNSTATSQQATAILERLAALSTLHGRMCAARDVLSLAESWSTLSLDVTAYLADAKFETAAARLSKAKSSLSVFERTPEYESHRKLLDGLGNTLETRMLPTLIDAIRDRDVEQCVKLSKVFRTIDRQVQYAQIWRRTRGEECEEKWRQIGEIRDASSFTLAGHLKNFAVTLIALLEQEGKIVGQVFPDRPREHVERLASSVLDGLQPSLKEKLTVSISRQHTNAVLQVEQVHLALRYASIGLAESISKTGAVNGIVAETPSTITATNNAPHNVAVTSPDSKSRATVSAGSAMNPAHARRLSTRRISSAGVAKTTPDTSSGDAATIAPASTADRMSRWDAILSLLPAAQDWETKLYQPLLEYQMDYGALEKLHLHDAAQTYLDAVATSATTLNKPQQVGHSAELLLGHDLAAALRDSISKIVELATAAAHRARSLTYGMGCDVLFSSVDDILSSLLSHNKKTLDSRTAGALEAAQRQANEAVAEGKDRMDGLYGTEGGPSSSSIEGAEWKAFDEGMTLLASLRGVSEQIDAMELGMVDQFVDLADFLLITPAMQSATRHTEMLQRLCCDTLGMCTASFRLLLEASADQLRTGDLMRVLHHIRSIAAAAPSATRARKTPLSPNTQPYILFHAARSALLDQARALQRHLINMILSPLMPHLQVYATLSIWSASRLPGSVNEYDLTMPTFSLSPTADMSRIGEALLDLPRLLEVWSELPQFRWGVQGLPFAPPSAKEIFAGEMPLTSVDTELLTFLDATHDSPSPSPKREKRLSLHGSTIATSPVMDRRSSSGTHHRHTPSVASIATLPARNEQTKRQEEQQQAAPAAAAATAAEAAGISAQSALQSYLTSISLTLISHLVSLVLPSITQLSGPGASQLAADLEYLLTILAALNVSQQEQSKSWTSTTAHDDEIVALIRTLEAWQDVCRIKDADGRRLRHLVRTGQVARRASLGEPIAGFDGDQDKLRSLLGTQAFDMIARMRGW